MRSERKLAPRLLLLASLLIGAAARLVTWPLCFTRTGIQFLADTDPLYHLERARQILASFPRAAWDDPGLNFPVGAQIPWPPLFDWLIAAAAWAVGLGHPGPAQLESVGALLPFALGMLTLASVYWLGSLLVSGEVGALATLVMALLPAHAAYCVVGRPDQHIAELAVSTLVFGLWARMLRSPQRPPFRGSPALGAALALAFWTWQGSALYLGLLLAHASLSYLLDHDDGGRTAQRLALSLLLGALLLAASLAALGPAGVLLRQTLLGVTGVHCLLLVVSALFPGLLALSQRAGPAGASRVVIMLLAAAAACALALPGLRAALGQGWDALGSANGWYARLGEFQPLFFGGLDPLWTGLVRAYRLYGAGLVVMPLAAVPLWRAYRSSSAPRPLTLWTATWSLLLLVLALLKRRFDLYLSAALPVCVAMALVELASRVRALRGPRARGAALVAGALLVVAPGLPTLVSAEIVRGADRRASGQMEVVEQLARLPVDPVAPAVMAGLSYGHLVRYYAARPVVASPFGTEGGQGAMQDMAAFFDSADPGELEAIAARRKVGLLLLGPPTVEVLDAAGFAPSGTPPAFTERRDAVEGVARGLLPRFWDLAVSRLYYFDGMSSPVSAERLAVGGWRLLCESTATDAELGFAVPAYRLLGAVPGARLEIEAPVGAMAAVEIRTNTGRRFTWRTEASAASDGLVRLRVPYATGANGLVTAGACAVFAGGSSSALTLSAQEVERGAVRRLRFGPR